MRGFAEGDDTSVPDDLFQWLHVVETVPGFGCVETDRMASDPVANGSRFLRGEDRKERGDE